LLFLKILVIIKIYKIEEEISLKEATGELNMTVVTIIAIGAIIAFFWFMWPQISTTIQNTWNNISGSGGAGTQCPAGMNYNPNTGQCQ